MSASRVTGPLRIREILRQRSSRLILPFESLQGEDAGAVYVRTGGMAGPGGVDVPPQAAARRGVTFPGGESGLARLIGDVTAGAGAGAGAGLSADTVADTGVNTVQGELLQVRLPRDIFSWIADPALLWRTLAAHTGPGQVEVSLTTGGQLRRAFFTPGEVVWHCRTGDVGWIVVESDGGDERVLARGLQEMREVLRGSGVTGAEVTMEHSPPSLVQEDVKLLRLATARWVAWWPLPALNRLITRMAAPTPGEGVGDAATMQRAAAARIGDYYLRSGGIGTLVATLPRTAEERRGRYAVRTVVELLAAGGVAPRTLGESAYRSGNHYRALVSVVAGLASREEEILRRALGGRRWEQILDHSHRHFAPEPPWVQYCRGCDFLVRDLAERSRHRGQSPPAVVSELVKRFYLEPRDERLQDAWRKQVDSGAMAQALEEARLSLLRPLLRRLPRAILVQAGCGDTAEVKARISSTFSRAGRRIFLEDVSALEAQLKRRDGIGWDELLAARMSVRAVATRAVRVAGGR